MGSRTLSSSEKLIQEYYAQELPLLQKLRQEAIDNRCDHMIIAPSEARTLQILLELIQAQKVVEIGCLYGLSSLSMAQVSSVQKVWTLENSNENARVAQEYFNQTELGSKIELVLGDAQDNLEGIETFGPFDAVFVDADKSSYPLYVDWAYKNLRTGGLVICDNTFLSGAVWGEDVPRKTETQIQAMKSVHQDLGLSGRWISHTLPSFDGISIGIKK